MKNKSTIYTSSMIKVMYGLLVVCCIFAPYLAELYDQLFVSMGEPSVYVPLLVTLYCAVPPAFAALLCLDKLLSNITKEQSFVHKNVALLRIISYCCFVEGLVFIYFTMLKPFACIIVVSCAFMGLILRVIMNVFECALVLREENDFTI